MHGCLHAWPPATAPCVSSLARDSCSRRNHAACAMCPCQIGSCHTAPYSYHRTVRLGRVDEVQRQRQQQGSSQDHNCMCLAPLPSSGRPALALRYIYTSLLHHSVGEAAGGELSTERQPNPRQMLQRDEPKLGRDIRMLLRRKLCVIRSSPQTCERCDPPANVGR
jgi:hypothetical protein